MNCYSELHITDEKPWQLVWEGEESDHEIEEICSWVISGLLSPGTVPAYGGGGAKVCG